MPYEAKVLAHSVSTEPRAKPLFSMQLRYPRFVHAEALTHRVLSTAPELVEMASIPDGFMYDQNLSRNASSSRAIPVPRLLADIERDPAEPIFWGKNQAGMQAVEELEGQALKRAKQIWRQNRETCLQDARYLHMIGAHKQLVNRLVENHGHINVVCTATNWSNFFALRRHKDAQPEIRHLADLIWEAQQASTPKVLKPGEWHLPYVDEDEADVLAEVNARFGYSREDLTRVLIKLCVARCARVSYLTHDGKKPNVMDDLALYDRLVGSTPLHASPAEHQATPDERIVDAWLHPNLHGNLEGWQQFRKMLPNECA